MRVLDWVGLVALLAALPALVLFISFYGTRSDWRRYPVGRALMYSKVSLALTYLWVTVRLALTLTGHLSQPDPLGWQLVRICLFGAISATQWRLLFVLRKVQRAPDRDGWTVDKP